MMQHGRRVLWIGWAAAAMVVLALAAASEAAARGERSLVQVGDSPDLQVPTLAHGTIRLIDLRGRYVAIEFWSSSAMTSIIDMPTMIRLNRQYGPLGLQMIGISGDATPAAAHRIINEYHIPWPQHLDLMSRVARKWGVASRPRVYLVGPDGKVVWIGRPDALEGQLQTAFEGRILQANPKAPPQTAAASRPATTQAVPDPSLARAEFRARLAEGDLVAAGQVLAQARRDLPAEANLAELESELAKAAELALDEADRLIAGGEYAEAAGRLRAVLAATPDSQPAAVARLKLDELMEDPRARGKIEANDAAQDLKGPGR